MRWDVVVAAVVKALRDDSALTAALGGGSIEPMESNVERRIPSVRYTLIGDFEEETLNPITVQIDYWALSKQKAVTIEKRIRTVLSARRRASFNGVSMWILYLDSRDMDDPQPGTVHRSLDFRCVPVRAGLTQ